MKYDLGETAQEAAEKIAEAFKHLNQLVGEKEKEEVQQINGYDPNFLKFAAKQTKRRKKKK